MQVMEQLTNRNCRVTQERPMIRQWSAEATMTLGTAYSAETLFTFMLGDNLTTVQLTSSEYLSCGLEKMKE